jgi:DNA invertase Pin-like site-specific DNA recombinase
MFWIYTRTSSKSSFSRTSPGRQIGICIKRLHEQLPGVIVSGIYSDNCNSESVINTRLQWNNLIATLSENSESNHVIITESLSRLGRDVCN